MWCPSASLSVWANAWLAGSAAPDDVLDALSLWAPRHLVVSDDSPVDETSAVTLLRMLRTTGGGQLPSMNVVLPVPGDVRGLVAGTGFERDALAAGEAVIVADDRGSAIGLVPEFDYEDEESDSDVEPGLLIWTVYALPGRPAVPHLDLGEAEYALRSTVRSAAEAFGAIRPGVDVADPRRMVQQVLESGRAHRAPGNAPSRALRVLENAAHVDAIIAVSSGLISTGAKSSSEAQFASDTLKPLSAVVRSARLAAITAILHSAWR